MVLFAGLSLRAPTLWRLLVYALYNFVASSSLPCCRHCPPIWQTPNLQLSLTVPVARSSCLPPLLQVSSVLYPWSFQFPFFVKSLNVKHFVVVGNCFHPQSPTHSRVPYLIFSLFKSNGYLVCNNSLKVTFLIVNQLLLQACHTSQLATWEIGAETPSSPSLGTSSSPTDTMKPGGFEGIVTFTVVFILDRFVLVNVNIHTTRGKPEGSNVSLIPSLKDLMMLVGSLTCFFEGTIWWQSSTK